MAVNANAPHGFSPVGTILGADLSMACHMYYVPSTDATNTYSIGDVVASTNTSDASNVWGTFGIPGVTKVLTTTTAVCRGIVVGMFRDPFNLDTAYVPVAKSKNYYIMVYDDPYGQFEAQMDSTAFAATMPGMNVGFTSVANNAAVISNTVLTGSTVATTSTLPVKIVSVMQRPNVQTGTAPFMPLLCTWNSHELKSVGTTGV